jgi:hypothetical protein
MPVGERRTPRALAPVLWTAVAVSIVHYVDNYANHGDYPESSTLPNPSATTIVVAWFAFTAAGLAGYALVRRSSSALGPLLLAVYSGSGLIGIGHYTVAGATDMPWWRQAHVVLDVASGVAVLVVAIAALRSRRPCSSPAAAPPTR